jgi:hypothetical protein
MRLPPELKTILVKDSRLQGAVLLAFSEFEPWLDSSGTPFFPEFTDHSAKHVSEVLQTAASGSG